MRFSCKSIFLFLFLLVSSVSYCQLRLVGAGDNSSIYKISGNEIITLKQLKSNQAPQNLELIISNGKFWGTTSNGGNFGKGVIFTTNLDGTGYAKVHDFSPSSGAYPLGGLTEFEGKLWGTTVNNGAGHGVLYSINNDGTNYSVAHYFNETDGNGPTGKLTISGAKLWGVTQTGGTNSNGVIFSFSSSEGFQKQHDFSYSEGFVGFGDLLESNGRLWGTSFMGGSGGAGSLFSIKTNGTDFRVDYNFDWSNVATPMSSLTETNGRLWGTALVGGALGGGVLYSIATDGSDFAVEHEFLSADGSDGRGRLLHFNGKLWGTMMGGGSGTGGVIYSINEDGSGFTKYHEFNLISSDGNQPWCSLIESNGRFWGTTTTGGNKGNGILFSLANDGTDYRIERNFSDGEFTGFNPNSNFIDAGSRIIGTTRWGGNYNEGVIFSMLKDGSDYEITHHFDQSTGAEPTGLVKVDGKLWGMTSWGGVNNKGVIFSTDENGNNFNIVHHFTVLTGSNPVGQFVASEGSLWGVTTDGNGGAGNIFKFNPSSGTVDNIHDFAYPMGSDPGTSLTIGNGKFWGRASSVIYSLDLNGNNYSVAYTFNSQTYGNANGAMVYANGKIWGTSEKVLFSIDESNNFTVHKNDLNQSTGGLTFFQGKLYGVDRDQVFSINPDGSDFEEVAAVGPGQSLPYDGGSLVPIEFIEKPKAPSALFAEVKSVNRIELLWTDQSDNETGFEVFRSINNNSDYQLIRTVDSNTVKYTDETIISGSVYFYKIRAINASVPSDYSEEVTVSLLPSNLSARSVKMTSVELAWTDSYAGETAFEIFRSINDNSNYAMIKSMGANSTGFTDEGLTGVTTYFYRIRPVNANGISLLSNEISVTTLPAAPAIPSELVVKSFTSIEIQLTWKDNSDNETGFEIYQSHENQDFKLLHTTQANITSFVNKDLSPATTYQYKLRAINTGGNSEFSAAIEQKTLPDAPKVPTVLIASVIGEHEIKLSWTDNSDNETGFEIYRAVSDGSYELLKTTDINSIQYVDKDVLPGTICHYKILSFNTGGRSEFSNEVALKIVITSLEDESSDVLIYPNPFAEKIIIKNNRSDKFYIHVFNSTGQQITQERVEASQEVELDSTNWSQGIYLLKVGNTFRVVRILKQ